VRLFHLPGRRRRSARSPAALDPQQLPALTSTSGPPGALDHDAEFPRFQVTAGDQLARNDRFGQLRLKLRSAFTPSHPIVDRRMFAGRKEIVGQIIRSLEDQRLHTVVYGDRGIGKTSLLHVVAQAAHEARYLVIFVSIGANSDFDEVFRYVASKLPLLYHEDYGPTSEEAERAETFADILPPGPISVRLASELSGRLTGTRVLIFIDEFDRSLSIELQRNVAEFVKNLSDRQARAQLVIAGVADNLTDMLAEIPSIRRNICPIDVPRMSSDEVRQLVRRGEFVSGLSFDAEVVETIATVSNGLPYLASLLSQHMGLVALHDGRTRVELKDAPAAMRVVVDELRHQLTLRAQAQIEHLQPEAETILGQVAGQASIANAAFSLASVDTFFPAEATGQLCRRLLAAMSADGGLLQVWDNEFGRHYRFADPNAAQFLWLTAERRRLEREVGNASREPSSEGREYKGPAPAVARVQFK
jgi:hypothetical protein